MASTRSRQERLGTLSGALLRPAVFAPLLVLSGAALGGAFALRGLPPNDEGAVLTHAAKLLRGAVFYRDIDAYPFPGASHLLALGMGLFGERVAVARFASVGFHCLVLASLYRAATHLMDRTRAALFGLSLLALKLWAWPAFTAYMYSDVAFGFGCVAIALLVAHPRRGSGGRLLAAGAFTGLSLLCKQNLGIYLAAAAAGLLTLAPAAPGRPVRGRGAELALFGAGLALPVGAALLYFAGHGVVDRMLYSGLVRPFTGYLPTSGVAFSEPLAWWRFGSIQGMPAFPYFAGPYFTLLIRDALPNPDWYPVYWAAGELLTRCVYTSIPLAFAGAALVWIRGRRDGGGERQAPLLAAAALALAGVLSAFPRADFYHVISVYPLVLLLLFGLAGRRRKRAGRPPGAPWLAAGAVALALVASGALSLRFLASFTHRMRLPTAELRVAPEAAFVETLARFLREELAPDARLFVYGNEAYYYFFTQRFYPWRFVQLYPGQEGGDGGRALAALLQREPPEAVVQGMLSWPGLPPLPSYTPVLYRAIAARYEPDPRAFARHPPPAGVPPRWMVTLLRPRDHSR